jgi:hypothetical protein
LIKINSEIENIIKSIIVFKFFPNWLMFFLTRIFYH